MSYLKLMAKQSSHYFLSYALTMVAGFITFPIYTRLFSVSDYGTLSLITITVFFVMAIGKLGIQNSVIRFYDEVKNNKRPISLKNYYSTLFFGPITIIFAVCLIYALTIVILRNYKMEPKVANYFLLSAVVAFFSCSNMFIKNFLRAEHNTKLYNILGILSKYASLCLGVVFVRFIFKSLYGLFFALIIVEFLMFIYLVYRLRSKHGIDKSHFDMPFFKEAFRYGVPMVGTELTSIILNAGDRYVILYFMSTAAVGIYSAGYDLALNAMEALIFPLSFVITPLYLKIWVEKGKKETKEFLANCLRYFMMVALPCIFALNYLSKDITVLLASNKFEEAYRLVPYVSWGVLLFGLTNVFNAGLLINKKSYILAIWTIIAGVINIGLNFVLIPIYGYVGAAITTLIAYLFLFLILANKSFRYLSFNIDYKNISKYLLFSSIMIGFMNLFKFNNMFVNLAGKSILGFVLYFLLIMLFDKTVRIGIVSSVFRKKMYQENINIVKEIVSNIDK